MNSPRRRLKVSSRPEDQRHPELARMGLTHDDIHEALRRAVLARRREARDYVPEMIPGLVAWGEARRVLCERLVPRGGREFRERGLFGVMCPGGSDVIVIASGDDDTGSEDAPFGGCRNKRGLETQRAAELNRHQLAFEFAKEGPSGPRIWHLIWNAEKGIIKAEMYRIIELDQKGKVTQVDAESRICIPDFGIEDAESVEPRKTHAPNVPPVRRRRRE